MLCIFVAAVICNRGPAQEPKLSQLVLPAITNRNGYEEFVLAAEIVDNPLIQAYADPSSERLKALATDNPKWAGALRSLEGKSYFAVRQDAASRFASALELVRQGLRKPVFDPRTEVRPETTYPELVHFRSLARMFTYESYVRFAEGNPGGGTQSLMDGLEFAYDLSGGTLLSSLVGVACSKIVLSALQERLPMLSRANAKRLREVGASALKAPRQLSRAMSAERIAVLHALDSVFANPESLYALSGSEDKDEVSRNQRIVGTLKAGNANSLARMKRDAVSAAGDYFLSLSRLLELPEHEWFSGAAELMDTSRKGEDALVGDLIRSITPRGVQILAAEARLRTQFRLVELHGAVIQYKWDTGKLPTRLLQAVGDIEAKDPLSGQPFVYERTADGYRLYSLGNSYTGIIELKGGTGGSRPEQNANP